VGKKKKKGRILRNVAKQCSGLIEVERKSAFSLSKKKLPRPFGPRPRKKCGPEKKRRGASPHPFEGKKKEKGRGTA